MTEVNKNETPSNAGLTPEEHGELNLPGRLWQGGIEEKYKRIDALRAAHEGDGLATVALDAYDNRSEFYVRMREYNRSVFSGDSGNLAREKQWLISYYQKLGLDPEEYI